MEVAMAEIERLSIALPASMAAIVRRAVEDGEYTSTSEAIRDALRRREARRQPQECNLDLLRLRWDEGKASGRAGALRIPELIAEERIQLENGKP
jgi:antitoxin ParD1/3/4